MRARRPPAPCAQTERAVCAEQAVGQTARGSTGPASDSGASHSPSAQGDFEPDTYELECCICKKTFTGGGNNPYGYSVAYNDKKTGQRRKYKYPHSSYGSKVNRCCNTCDLRVQYWRGDAMTDRSFAAKKRRQADQDRNDVALLPPLKRQSEDSHCETRSKRARTKVTARGKNDVSMGPALGSGACRIPFAHTPEVQAAIDSIQEDALRAYAEQQTEQMLQRLLRENPAHASFADRLRELHAPVDGGQP